MTQELSHVVCKNCAARLAKWCYRRYWWFRLVREPLLLGMRILAWWHGIDARTHKVRNNECHGCIRFMKAELTAKSSIFCFFDKIIGKKVSKLRDSILTQDQLDEAKRYAREVSN
ncbi:MAG: hypothetical protein H6Q69_586 [Firmicutes bacterium]|nr:hypothetical protein [Bacillota bacterium]